jgi:hypothetical protein
MAMAVMAIGVAVAAAAAIKQGQQQKAMMEYNAEVARQEGIYRKQVAEVEIEDHKVRVAQLQGANIAQYGEKGLLFEGSPYDVLSMNERESLLDQKRIEHSGDYANNYQQQQALLSEMQGKIAVTQSYAKVGTLLASYGAGAAGGSSGSRMGTGTSGSMIGNKTMMGMGTGTGAAMGFTDYSIIGA